MKSAIVEREVGDSGNERRLLEEGLAGGVYQPSTRLTVNFLGNACMSTGYGEQALDRR
jgi:hypothetical protein